MYLIAAKTGNIGLFQVPYFQNDHQTVPPRFIVALSYQYCSLCAIVLAYSLLCIAYIFVRSRP